MSAGGPRRGLFSSHTNDAQDPGSRYSKRRTSTKSISKLLVRTKVSMSCTDTRSKVGKLESDQMRKEYVRHCNVILSGSHFSSLNKVAEEAVVRESQ